MLSLKVWLHGCLHSVGWLQCTDKLLSAMLGKFNVLRCGRNTSQKANASTQPKNLAPRQLHTVFNSRQQLATVSTQHPASGLLLLLPEPRVLSICQRCTARHSCHVTIDQHCVAGLWDHTKKGPESMRANQTGCAAWCAVVCNKLNNAQHRLRTQQASSLCGTSLTTIALKPSAQARRCMQPCIRPAHPQACCPPWPLS